MVSYHPTKFDGHRGFDSEGTILLVVKGQDFTCSHLILSLLFVSKVHDMITIFATLSSDGHMLPG